MSVFGVFWSVFPTFKLNTVRYGLSHCIQSKSGKIRTRKTPNTDTFTVILIIIKIADVSRRVYKMDKSSLDKPLKILIILFRRK